jgi:hypothetical protein
MLDISQARNSTYISVLRRHYTPASACLRVVEGNQQVHGNGICSNFESTKLSVEGPRILAFAMYTFVPSDVHFDQLGIATGYGLDGPGIEYEWAENFRNRPDRSWGPPSLPYKGYRVFPGGKAAGAWH